MVFVAPEGAERRPESLVAAASVMLVVSTVCVAGRLYSHFSISKKINTDDYFILVALASAGLLLASIIIEHNNGLGYHAKDLSMENVSHFLRAFWINLWSYNIALTCTKFSILFQYRRIFVTPRFQTAVKVMLAIIAVYGLWTIFGCVFICWPIKYLWDRSIEGGKCIPTWPLFLGNSYMNIITDFMILFSPMPVIKSLQLPRRQKFALMGVFAIAFLVIIVSIVRIVIFEKSNGATDFSYANIVLGIVSYVECSMGIICSSAPALKPLIVKILPAFGTSSNGTRSKTYQTGGSKMQTNQEAEKGTVTRPNDGEDGLFERPDSNGHGGVEMSKSGIDGTRVVTTVVAMRQESDAN